MKLSAEKKNIGPKSLAIFALAAIAIGASACASNTRTADTDVWRADSAANESSTHNGAPMSGDVGATASSNGAYTVGPVTAVGSSNNNTTSVYNRPPLVGPGGYVQHYSMTVSCAGQYSRTDASGRIVASGRAYNTGTGLVALDARGNRGNLIPASENQSLYFLPDCNCAALARSAENGQARVADNTPANQCVAAPRG